MTIQKKFFKAVQLSLVVLIVLSCRAHKTVLPSNGNSTVSQLSIVILGNVQDGGSPHIGCQKNCCKDLFLKPDANRKVVALGVVDAIDNKKYIFEATPDLTSQMKALKQYLPQNTQEAPNGIFLTHAHIGHYAGLMYLGREALGAKNVPVYAMPKMKAFLESNGPWGQLVSQKNIEIKPIQNEQILPLSNQLSVMPIIVPHRDEYSETVGFIIIGQRKKALFIPDIDKWEKWDKNIVAEIAKVDYAFVDATFFDSEEVNHRNISEIPHPFVIESLNLLNHLPDAEKKKVHFIHFNHTNPLLNEASRQTQQVLKNGFKIARIYDVYDL